MDAIGRKQARCNFLFETKCKTMFDIIVMLCYYINIKQKARKTKMKSIENKKCKQYIYEFNSITDLIYWIENTKEYPCFNTPYNSKNLGFDFTGTKSYDEAKELLLHGWEHGTKEIKKQLDVKNTGISVKQKTVYDVAGFQCSVPRYLQGVPTNMINKKQMQQKNKIITINKLCSYSSTVPKKKIEDESVKVLQLVNRIEKQGYRVNLNILFGSKEQSKVVYKLNIKPSSQKLNIKQTAFPLVHPSMLRRIMFSAIERTEVCSKEGFERGYGKVLDTFDFINVLKNNNLYKKNEYIIPSIVYDNEITNIEEYKVK